MDTSFDYLLEQSKLVVAHPDDEVLWFSSVLEHVEQVIICFLEFPPQPALGTARRASLSAYPLNTAECLEIDESQSFDDRNWRDPMETAYGVKITRHRQASTRYEQNYSILVTCLRERLKNCRNVFTHNPWGEYGHEEHVQVYRAIEFLQRELGFRIWFSNYCGNRSAKLMLAWLAERKMEHVTLPTNRALSHQIANLYKRHGCWTWFDDYNPPSEESFLRDITGDAPVDLQHQLVPINMLYTRFSTAEKRTKGGFRRFAQIMRRSGRLLVRASSRFGSPT